MAGELLNLGDVIAHFKADTKGFQSGVKEAQHSIGGLMKSATAGSVAVAGAMGAAAVGVGAFIKQGISLSAQLETNRIGFITLLGSAEKADEALKMIKKDAASTPFELPGLIQANQLLTSVTKDAPRSERMLLNVGKALTAMGKGQNELDRIIVNLQQIGAVGKASMIDIKQFAFAGIPIFEMLKESTGATGEALEDMISNGEISFELIEKMFQEAGEGSGKFAKAFENAQGSFSQVMSNFKDNVAVFLSDFVKASGIFDLAKAALNRLMEAVGNLGKILNESGIRGLWEQVVPSWLKDNLYAIAGALVGALIPAIWAAAAGLWAMFAPLVPFIAAGALIGALVQLIAERMGGWHEVLNRLKELWEKINPVVSFLIDYFKLLYTTVRDLVVPQFEMMKESLAPLLPFLKQLAIVFGVILVGALVALVTGVSVIVVAIVTFIRILIDWFMKWYQEVQKDVDLIISVLTDFPGTIRDILKGVYAAIVDPFRNAFNKVKDMADEVWEKLQKINPFHRESPSLIDNIKHGMSIIGKEYEKLGSVAGALPNAGQLAGVGGAGNVTVNFGDISVRDNNDLKAIINAVDEHLGNQGVTRRFGVG